VTLRSASAERSIRSAGTQLVRAYLLGVDADRPKHIDDYIDYFGTGRTLDGIPRAHTSWGEDGHDGSSGVSQWCRP
jgi:hypothetical protein